MPLAANGKSKSFTPMRRRHPLHHGPHRLFDPFDDSAVGEFVKFGSRDPKSGIGL